MLKCPFICFSTVTSRTKCNKVPSTVSSFWGKCNKLPTLAPIRCISGVECGKVPQGSSLLCKTWQALLLWNSPAMSDEQWIRKICWNLILIGMLWSFPFQVRDKSEHCWSNLDSLPVLFIGLYILFQAAMQHAYQIWWALSWKWNASKSPAERKLWPVNPRFRSDGCKMPFYEHRQWSGDGAGPLRLILWTWGLLVIKASEGAKEGAGSVCDTSFRQRGKKKWISGSW